MVNALKKHMSVDPHIDKLLDVSTVHITKEDSKLLLRNAQADEERDPRDFLYVIEHEHGFFVYACELSIEEKRKLYVIGYSEALIDLICKALNLGCKWVCLDGDGFTYEDLPSFEW